MAEEQVKPTEQETPEKTNQTSYMDILKYLLVIVIVVSLGVFAVNQFFSFRYKAYFLKQPCNLCQELNPQFVDCFKKVEKVYIGNPSLENEIDPKLLNFSDGYLPF